MGMVCSSCIAAISKVVKAEPMNQHKSDREPGAEPRIRI